jgi:hypothetical protein
MRMMRMTMMYAKTLKAKKTERKAKSQVQIDHAHRLPEAFGMWKMTRSDTEHHHEEIKALTLHLIVYYEVPCHKGA